jgi:hypothetical protein
VHRYYQQIFMATYETIFLQPETVLSLVGMIWLFLFFERMDFFFLLLYLVLLLQLSLKSLYWALKVIIEMSSLS